MIRLPSLSSITTQKTSTITTGKMSDSLGTDKTTAVSSLSVGVNSAKSLYLDVKNA